MLVLVTGGAGFIGSNLIDQLVRDGHSVRIFDNFSTGKYEFISHLESNSSVQVFNDDLLDSNAIQNAVRDCDAVVHLAANADVRFGWNHPRRDYEQNVLATQNVLEAMRISEVRRLIFSSTGSVYGESPIIPTPENAPYPVQTSLYGASKNAAEGLISAYAEGGFLDATVFRFVSILGPRYSHGHVIDFVAQLVEHPDELLVLGDGSQRKSYLHVNDCVNAITARLSSSPKFETLNLGVDSFCQVKDSIGWIIERMGVSPKIRFTGGERGWIGDNPFIYLSIEAMQGFGWAPSSTIRGAIEDTVDWIMTNKWVLSSAIIH
jgi:UDP-glucose 4-epimerase